MILILLSCKFIFYACSVYCYKCIDDLASKNVRENIIKEEGWLCFICNKNEKINDISLRPDWKENVGNV